MAGQRGADAPAFSAAGQRIDKWLWCARFLKTRSLAAAFVAQGLIRMERGGAVVRIEKASAVVRPGDRLSLAIGGRLMSIEIAALALRRGPAVEARKLYLDLSQPAAANADGTGDAASSGVASPRAVPQSRNDGPSPGRRPDRRERRAIGRLKDSR